MSDVLFSFLFILTSTWANIAEDHETTIFILSLSGKITDFLNIYVCIDKFESS